MERMEIIRVDGGAEHAEKRRILATESQLAWMASAWSLERSADILWETLEKDWESCFKSEPIEEEFIPSVGPTFMLLAGLAVENYLKAICIKTFGAFGENGKFMYGTHNLIKLATNTGLAFSTAESELIERLEQFVVFAGRHPSPKDSEALIPRIHSDGSWGVLGNVTGGDHNSWKDLLTKLREEAQILTLHSVEQRN